MSESKLLHYPFCSENLLEKLENTSTVEIASEVWMIEGFGGEDFFLEPPSSNIFILRDGDLVLLIDSGLHPFYRERMLEVLRKCSNDGAKELVLMVSHGHWDHGNNNNIIYEAGFEKARFLLPEIEVNTININSHMTGGYEKALKFFDWYEHIFPMLRYFMDNAKKHPEYHDPKYQSTWEAIESLPDEYDRSVLPQTRDAQKLLLDNIMSPDLSSYIADRAEILKLSDREKIRLGDQEFEGWPVGRFFAIHEGSQSPGHISIYDPKNKLMITGDATLEINPPFFDSSLTNIIDLCKKLRIVSEQGFVEMATDAHRSSQFWTENLKTKGMEPFNSLQLVDVAKGPDECVSFYQMWEEYFVQLKQEAMTAHSKIGEASIDDILEELGKSTNQHVSFYFGCIPPYLPGCPPLLPTRILDEAGASSRVVGDRILFTPCGD